jgi:hypothetical protein
MASARRTEPDLVAGRAAAEKFYIANLRADRHIVGDVPQADLRGVAQPAG